METKRHLLEREWIFVTSIIFIMLSMVLVGKINASRSSSILAAHPLTSHEPCIVFIEGAVSKPGRYLVSPGTPLKNIIKKSSPTPFADLKKICMEDRIEKSVSIHIETLTEITITIEGDRVVVPAGTRVCQLKKYVSIDSKNKLLKSRRFLKDLETISLN